MPFGHPQVAPGHPGPAKGPQSPLVQVNPPFQAIGAVPVAVSQSHVNVPVPWHVSPCQRGGAVNVTVAVSEPGLLNLPAMVPFHSTDMVSAHVPETVSPDWVSSAFIVIVPQSHPTPAALPAIVPTQLPPMFGVVVGTGYAGAGEVGVGVGLVGAAGVEDDPPQEAASPATQTKARTRTA